MRMTDLFPSFRCLGGRVCVCVCVKHIKSNWTKMLLPCGSLPSGSAAAGVLHSIRSFSPWLFPKITDSTAPASSSFTASHPAAYFWVTTPSISSLRQCPASFLLLPSGNFSKNPPAFLAGLAQVLSADSLYINSPKQPFVPQLLKGWGGASLFVWSLSSRADGDPHHLFPIEAVIGSSSSYTLTRSVFDSVAVVPLALLGRACAKPDAAGSTDAWLTPCRC